MLTDSASAPARLTVWETPVPAPPAMKVVVPPKGAAPVRSARCQIRSNVRF